MNAVRVASAGDAYLQQAVRIVHGYFTRRGDGLRFEVETEDAAKHKISDPHEFAGSTLSAMTAAARSIDPAAKEFSSSKEDAVDAWGHRDFEKAVSIDPDFGAAWLAWLESELAQRNTSQAMETADRALARTSLRGDLDRARIELIAANLHNDSSRRLQALRTLVKETNDRATTLVLAQAEVNARDFNAAIATLQSVLAATSDDSSALLSLGYAQAYAGAVDAAKSTLERYGRLPGQKPNSLDSLGEAYFMNGRFAEAENYFLEAQQSNPGFLGGSDLLKAAYAHWLGGDLPGADAIAARYLAAQKNDPWGAAAWFFATGRREQAEANLKRVADPNLAQRQLAIWRASLPADLETLKARYEQSPPSEDNTFRTFYAAALAKAGRKDEARKLVARWPLPAPQNGDPLVETLVFPTFLEVRKAVGAP